MWLDFASKYCTNAKFILKTDDDILINMFNIRGHLEYLNKYSIINDRTILCKLYDDRTMPVIRDPKNKW